jgi:NTP pyrophosphatase (non-canonical NTP hydrolase)
MKEIEELIELSKYNHKLDSKRGQEVYLNLEWALNQIKAEVEEVKAELKPNNIPKIEDELGDILWGFFMSMEKFKYDGYEIDVKRVIKRALKKYKERVLPLKGEIKADREIWDRVKEKQKRELLEEIENG